MKTNLLILVLLLAALGCKTSKKTSQRTNLVENEHYPYEIYIKTHPCFGKCPVFELTIQQDGLMIYTGQYFTEKEGKYSKQIEDKDYHAVLQLIQEADFFALEDVYDNKQIMDLPSIIFRVSNEQNSKQIENRFGGPAILDKLGSKLKEITATEDGWEKIK